jgi:hypothetical protein
MSKPDNNGKNNRTEGGILMMGSNSELKNQFKINNGIWDELEVTSKLAKQIAYKLRMALGSTWNPTIEKLHRIQGSQNLKN